MNVLHIKDLSNGQIHFTWQRGTSLPIQYSNPISVSNPLNLEEREELRWYLEDYLSNPYGFEFRAKKVEDKMTQWGESLFKMIFIKSQEDPDPRGMYQEAVREGLENCEVCISSNDSSFLNIPWELIKDPTPGRGYLAPLLGGLYRQRIGLKIEISKSPYLDDKLFRILLVISRPKGEADIPYGTVSRPLLEALHPFGSRIKLEVLRPPTFEALVEKLNEKPGYYSLVHFDGHGSFESRSTNGNSMKYGTMENHGCLVFEKDEGYQFVDSRELGQALARAKVPLFVLNACQSAVEGENEAFSSVASQLVAVGAKGVVAMGYSVYANAASQFIKKFYENLIKSKSLSEAVAAGRRSLHANCLRDSVVGQIEFRDWMVPTLYQQEQNYIPIPLGSVNDPNPNQNEQDLSKYAEEACPEGRFGFIGRDNDILRIEQELRNNNIPWILLSGMGGTGKTELAYGFARWYAETGGCNGGVFKTSFKEKADFGHIIGSIVGYGTDFSKYSSGEQFQKLVRYLQENPCLLIWDNFESVSGYPHGSNPIATVDELTTISFFLKSLKGGKSRVIITTRKENENWLGIAISLVRISGLNHRDRAEFAKIILKTIGRKPEDFRHDYNYRELLKQLNGHPRSLEVVLPQLRNKSPIEIIKALQHNVNEFGEKIEDASLSFAFSQLSSLTKKHLPILGLFASRVNIKFLELFVRNESAENVTYEKVVGETPNLKDWETILEEAAINGFVESKNGEYYELHPTLPFFFRKQLVANVGEIGLKTLDKEFINFYSSFASSIYEDIKKSEPVTKMVLTIEESNFIRALRSAEINEDWEAIDPISRVILEFYEYSGRIAEANTFRMHLLSKIDMKLTANDQNQKISFLRYLLAREAHYLMSINELEEAKMIYEQVLNNLFSLEDLMEDPIIGDDIATVYHQLGLVAQNSDNYDEAESYYKKALEIRERLENKSKAAESYCQLGTIAYKREQYDNAETLYWKALEIFEDLGPERYTAAIYHQLGVIAQEREQYEDAEKWYRKALEIKEYLWLEQEAASDYHQLGMVFQKRKQYDDAEKWYRKALKVYEPLGLKRHMAASYHQLGVIAQERKQYEDAEKWYMKALEALEHLMHPPLKVMTLSQLGDLYREQNMFKEAVSYSGKALAIATHFKMNVYKDILVNLSQTMKVIGKETFKEYWVREFDKQDDTIQIIEYISIKLEENGKKV